MGPATDTLRIGINTDFVNQCKATYNDSWLEFNVTKIMKFGERRSSIGYDKKY
jgi:hypothetical protein